MMHPILDYLRYRRINRVVRDKIIKQANAGGMVFEVGDRVKAIDHRRVDDSGGTGTVVEANAVMSGLNLVGYRVQFDSFPPNFPLWMASSELQYDR